MPLQSALSFTTLITLLWLSLPSEGFAQTQSTAPATPRVIAADLSRTNGPLNTAFKVFVGAGRANEGLRADWQRQLRYVHRQCGFTYIRMHGLFTDDMGVYREDKAGNPEYNWQYIDELYDFLQSIGMKPFVELSFMPRALAAGHQTIFWWNGIVNQPRDLSKWGNFIRAFVQHVRDRYGDDELKTWYFEVWNEPNLSGFFAGTQSNYFNLYAETARAVKSVSPAYRVGGPATAGCAWVPPFIRFCVSNQVPVDFISTHTYAVDQGYLDESGSRGTVLSSNPKSIYGDVQSVRHQIQTSALPNLELHFTEWSASYTPSDPIHDSYHSAAFIVDRLRKTGNAANSMSYWTFTDIFEEAGPRWTPFHGGFGLLNYQDIAKPAFYAYQFLNKLGPIELQSSDPSSWICKDNNGGIQALIWDFTYIHPDKGENNQVYYKRDLPAGKKGAVRLELSHVAPGRYGLACYRIGYRANDAYSTYLDLGSPNQLTRVQVDYIKAVNSGAPELQTLVTIGEDGRLQREFDLRANDLVLITLTRLTDTPPGP